MSMHERNPEQPLLVVESNGAPRSGKGTITAGLAQAFVGSAQDETGADYRAVTYGLLNDGHIDEEMSKAEIGLALEDVDLAAIADYAALRYEVDQDELYRNPTDSVVSRVSTHDIIRDPIKAGFAKRVAKKVDDPNVRILFVDGRNLGPVIGKVQGAELLLRMFVDCQPFIGAHREGLRDPSIDQDSPDYEAWYVERVERLRNRQKEDEIRPNDPAIRDADALDYWFNNDLLHETGLHVADDLGIPFHRAVQMLATGRGEDFRKGGRYGAGAKGTAESRQVYFDTSEIGRDAMLSLAHRMVEEALEQRAGRYHPLYDGLIRT